MKSKQLITVGAALVVAGSVASASAATLGGAQVADLAVDEVVPVQCADGFAAVSTGTSFSEVALFGSNVVCPAGADLTLVGPGGVAGSGGGTLPGGPAVMGGPVSYVNALDAAGAVGGFGVDVDYASRVGWWKLDDLSSSGPAVVLDDGFEVFGGWSEFSGGDVVPSSTYVRSGSGSALKTANNDPAGASKLLADVVDDFVLDVWLYRESTWVGGSIDRLGLLDAALNGYSFAANHSSNTLYIDRRDAGLPQRVSAQVPFDPPEGVWWRMQLSRVGASLTATAFDAAGSSLASVSVVDSTYGSVDRAAVHGGWNYWIDDLSVSGESDSSPSAADAAASANGFYQGGYISGVAGVAGDGGTAVDFDGSTGVVLLPSVDQLETGFSRAERSVSLWFNADRVGRSQVLYEEGGSSTGLAIEVRFGRLWARAWSDDGGWSQDLEVQSGRVQRGDDVHVVVVLDAVETRTLSMYVDGVAVGSDTKADSSAWPAHLDGVAVGGVAGTSRLTSGNVTGGANFDGVIDDVQVFHTAVSTEMVQRLNSSAV